MKSLLLGLGMGLGLSMALTACDSGMCATGIDSEVERLVQADEPELYTEIAEASATHELRSEDAPGSDTTVELSVTQVDDVRRISEVECSEVTSSTVVSAVTVSVATDDGQLAFEHPGYVAIDNGTPVLTLQSATVQLSPEELEAITLPSLGDDQVVFGMSVDVTPEREVLIQALSQEADCSSCEIQEHRLGSFRQAPHSDAVTYL